MKTCVAGALGVNTNTCRKARETRLGHAIEPRPETTRNRRNGEFALPRAMWVVRVQAMRCRRAPLAKLIRCVLLVSAGMGFGGYLGARESMQITYTSIRVVDYHDQLELPVPRLAGLETLVGRQQAESALASLSPRGRRRTSASIVDARGLQG